MTNKTLAFALLCLVFLPILLSSCKKTNQNVTELYTLYQGEIIGTYYKLTFLGNGINKEEIEDLMNEVDLSVSTWKKQTPISQFNLTRDTQWHKITNPHFIANTKAAIDIHQASQGYFDPSVGPLMDYYGFGKDASKIEELDSAAVLKIKAYSTLSAVVFDTSEGLAIKKNHPKAMLDYSAIAKGYLVDEVAELLLEAGISNFLVDIGGELRASGINERKELWTIAINTPEISAALNDGFDYLQLSDVSLATSGNYRNNYQIGDQMIVHTMNPHTGFPEINSLKSVTIIAPDCMTADAWATACMSAGLEQAKEFIETNPQLEAYFIYTTDGTELKSSWTLGMEKYLNKGK